MVRLVFPVALAFLLLGSVHVVKAGTRGDAVVRVALCSDCHGTLTGYCGRPVKDESPVLIFPNGFQPGEVIFGGNRVRVGQLYLVSDPLQVLTAFESGVENVVAFLTDGISAHELEMLASLMDERHCETAELF